jgi:hypothetical protein
MGESENFWTILLYAEKALASITHSQIGGINGDKTGSSG